MGFSLGSLLGAAAPAAGALIGNMLVPGAGGLIGGALVGSGVSSAVSSDQALKAQESANKANIDMTNVTNAQAIELANTAHQREVKDLAAAGLNPILSAKYGGSATPSLVTPSMSSLSSVISSNAKQAQDSASGFASMGAQFQLQKSQVALNSAQAVKAQAEANAANTHSIGMAIDNYRKGQNLPADAVAASNRKWEEDSRARRWGPIKAAGLGLKDTGESALGFLKLAK